MTSIATMPAVQVELGFSPPFGYPNQLSTADSLFSVGCGWTPSSTYASAVFGLTEVGESAVRIITGNSTGSDDVVLTSTGYPAVAGQTYTFTIAAIAPSTGGWSVGVDAIWLGADGEIGSVGLPVSAGSSSWSFAHVQGTAPLGAISVQLVVEVDGPSGTEFYLSQPGIFPGVVTGWTAGGKLGQIPGWTDISAYVRSFKTTTGRQHELSEVEAGTLSIVLDNRDGRFNTWNTSSPYATVGTGLVPEMPIRVTATWEGTTYPIFYGYVDSWIPKWANIMSQDLEISASDILGLLAVNDFNSTLYAQTVADNGAIALYRLGDPGTPVGGGIAYAAPAPGVGTAYYYITLPSGTYIGAGFAWGQTGPFVTDATPATEFGSSSDIGMVQIPGGLIPSTDPPFTPSSFTVSIWAQLTTPSAVQCIWALGGPGALAIVSNPVGPGISECQVGSEPGEASSVDVYDGNWHMLTVTYSLVTGQNDLWIDGVAQGGYYWDPLPSSVITIGNLPDGTQQLTEGILANFSVYPGVLTAEQIQAEYAVGTLGDAVELSGTRVREILSFGGVPSDLQSLDAGASEIQPISTVGLANGDNTEGGTGINSSTLVGTKLLDYLQQVNTTECGLIFQAPTGVFTFLDREYQLTVTRTPVATYEDAPGSSFFYRLAGWNPGLDNLDLWNEVISNAQEYDQLGITGSNQIFENPAAQLQYGKRTYPNSTGLLSASDADALNFSNYVGLRYSQPVHRIRSIDMDSTTNNGGNLPQMLGRGLWDQVEVIYHGMVGGTALSQQQLIEGIDHDVSADEWVTTFHFSPADPNTYLILNDSTRGTLAALGATTGNRIAY